MLTCRHVMPCVVRSLPSPLPVAAEVDTTTEGEPARKKVVRRRLSEIGRRAALTSRAASADMRSSLAVAAGV
jgi:hypothetical protein